jgi:hypothetical protein
MLLIGATMIVYLIIEWGGKLSEKARPDET